MQAFEHINCCVYKNESRKMLNIVLFSNISKSFNGVKKAFDIIDQLISNLRFQTLNLKHLLLKKKHTQPQKFSRPAMHNFFFCTQFATFSPFDVTSTLISYHKLKNVRRTTIIEAIVVVAQLFMFPKVIVDHKFHYHHHFCDDMPDESQASVTFSLFFV